MKLVSSVKIQNCSKIFWVTIKKVFRRPSRYVLVAVRQDFLDGFWYCYHPQFGVWISYWNREKNISRIISSFLFLFNTQSLLSDKESVSTNIQDDKIICIFRKFVFSSPRLLRLVTLEFSVIFWHGCSHDIVATWETISLLQLCLWFEHGHDGKIFKLRFTNLFIREEYFWNITF